MRLQAGEAAQNMPGWLRTGLGRRVVGEAPVILPVAVSGEAARVRIMVRYILERRQPEPSAGFA